MGMFSDKTDQFQAVFMNTETGDTQIKTTYITDTEGNRFDVKALKKAVEDIMKDEARKEDLERVFAFGAGFVDGNSQATGFLIAWLVQKFMTQHETGNKTKLSLSMETHEVSPEELKEYTIKKLEHYITVIKDDDGSNITNVPANPTGGITDKTF